MTRDTAKNNKQLVALFENARQVIKADAALQKAGVESTIKPVPEKYSTECGMCIEFANSNLERFTQITQQIGYTPQIHDC